MTQVIVGVVTEIARKSGVTGEAQEFILDHVAGTKVTCRDNGGP